MNQSRQYKEDAVSPGQAGRSGARRWLLLSLLVAVVGIGLSVLAFQLLLTREQRLAEVQFQHDSARRVEAVHRVMRDRVSAVAMLSAYYAGSEVVHRREFDTFVVPLLRHREGVQFVGWAPSVSAGTSRSLRASGPEERISEIPDYGARRSRPSCSRRQASGIFPDPFHPTVAAE